MIPSQARKRKRSSVQNFVQNQNIDPDRVAKAMTAALRILCNDPTISVTSVRKNK